MAVETVLVVDDNELNRQLAEAHLAADGYAVMLANDGEEALRKFQESPVDLVLLDIVMPGIDGFETCRKMRSMPQGTDVPIVFLSALADLGSHQKALSAGGDDLLPKPINRSEMLLRVKSMMWLRKLRSELKSGYNLISSQRDALLHAQRQKEELTNLIVHDLKNPVGIVLAYSTHLLDRGREINDPQVIEIARQVSLCATTMEQMVLKMLDISRSEDGKFEAKLAPTDLEELLKEIHTNMNLRAENRKVRVGLKTALAMPVVQADAGILRRMIQNLVDNAIRFASTEGEVVIEAVGGKGRPVEFRVRDDGPGIVAGQREKIFDKYFQGDGGSSEYNHGLGLTFCRLAAESHGGKIWVEDNKPTGAVFCVNIPFAEAVTANG